MFTFLCSSMCFMFSMHASIVPMAPEALLASSMKLIKRNRIKAANMLYENWMHQASSLFGRICKPPALLPVLNDELTARP